MKKVWPWIFGIAFGLIILANLVANRSTRQVYWIHHGAEGQRVVVAMELSDAAKLWRLHHYYQR
jgi:hypothetical protein